jgi:uncharacterized protein
MATKGSVGAPTPRASRLACIGLALLVSPPAQQSQANSLPPPQAKPVRSLLALRNERVVRQEWDLTCGAAAVATLLTYQLNDPVSEREAALGMLRTGDIRLVRARLGFSLLDLKRFVASRGFVATGYGELELNELLAMAPIIVPIRVRNFGHFVVLRGAQEDRVLLADPAFGNRTMTLDAFNKAWTHKVGFVVVRASEPHPPNRMTAPSSLFLTPSQMALRTSIPALRSKGR